MTLYDRIGGHYADMRRADPRIAAAVDAALGDAAEIVNVGAGTGSYEPRGRAVIAVEPSEVMIRQRPQDAAPCIRGTAEDIPLASGSRDAAMAILTVHHWHDLQRGLREMRRVARRRVVLLTWVPDGEDFWLTRDYFPEILRFDLQRFPSTDALTSLLNADVGPTEVSILPIPHDCTDGFLCAYWRRPEAYLDPVKRGAISSFSLFSADNGIARLRSDLDDGSWYRRNGHLLSLNGLDLGYRIARCEIGASGDSGVGRDL